MIVFIDLGNQIPENHVAFAFYDRRMERFVSFRGIHIWNSEQSFRRDYIPSDESLEYFLSKIPTHFKQNRLNNKSITIGD